LFHARHARHASFLSSADEAAAVTTLMPRRSLLFSFHRRTRQLHAAISLPARSFDTAC